jgi:hypothetical protein
MVGSWHTRRLATIGVAAVFILATSGCYYAGSAITPENGALWCPAGVDLGPGHISSGGNGSGDSGTLWQPAPTAVTLRFEVTNSDMGLPVGATAVSTTTAEVSFGVVWDGTKSTGIKSIPWNGAPFVPAVFVQDFYSASFHITWWLMAVDAAGKEVGFTCSP